MEHDGNKLIGRAGELTFLRRVRDEARSGQFRLAAVEGESGLGKSWLLHHVVENARRDGFAVGTSTCYDHRTPPYNAWTELIRSLVYQIVGEEFVSPFDAYLERRRRGPVSFEHHHEEQAHLLREVGDCLTGLIGERPMLIAIDGIQWLDPQSVDLLSYLSTLLGDRASYRRTPVMVMVTWRRSQIRGAVRKTVARLSREMWASMMELSPMDRPKIAELIEAGGIHRPSNHLVEIVAELTAGNPMTIRNMTRQLQRSGTIVERGGSSMVRDAATLKAWTDRDADDADEAEERLEQLSPVAIRLLSAAALIGQRFDPETLAEASGSDLGFVERGLDSAGGIVSRDGKGYHFESGPFRQALIRRLGAGGREALHAEIAGRLEATRGNGPPERDWQILQHLLGAGRASPPRQLYRFGRLVGDQASSVFAWETAATAYEAAASDAPDAAERAEMHMNAGTCFRFGWDIGPSIWQFEQAERAFRSAGMERRATEALVQRARQTVRTVSPGTLVDLAPFDTALELVGDSDPALRGYVLTRLSDAYSHGHRGAEAVRVATQARALAVSLNDPELLNDACTFLGLAEQLSGNLVRAIENYRTAIDCAERLNRPWLKNIPQQRLGMALLMRGELDAAEQAAREGLENARRTRYPGEECMGHATLTMIAAARGNVLDAETHGSDTQYLFERSRYPFGPFNGFRGLACARAHAGDGAGARDALRPLVEPGRVFERPQQRMSELFRLIGIYIRVHVEPGEDRTGEERIEAQEVVAGYFRNHLDRPPTAYAISEICLIADLAEDLRLTALYGPLRERLEWAVARGVTVTNGWTFLVPRVLGTLAFIAGDSERAESALLEAIGTAERIGAVPDLGRAHFEYARVLVARQTLEESIRARRHVREALDLFVQAGLGPWQERVMQFSADIGMPLSVNREAADRGALSERRRQILEQLTKGIAPDDISRSMVLSPDTVGSATAGFAEAAGFHERTRDTPVQMTLLVTDIEKSTPMLERLGDQEAQRVLRIHDQICRGALSRHGGVEIKNRGDGILASFHSIPEALGCARTIQSKLAAYNAVEGATPIRVRMGVHTGELIVEHEGLFGLNIHVAVRISEHCKPEHVLVSRKVWEFAQKLGLPFGYLGQIELKGLTSPVALYEFHWREDEASQPPA